MFQKFFGRINSKIIQSITEKISAKRDFRLFIKDFPKLTNYEHLYETTILRLQETHVDYITNISPGGSAVSLELACFLDLWCHVREPKFILDLGSGYSSYVFRSYQKKAHYPVRVVSVDNSPEWLEKTEEYLQTHALSTEELITSEALKGLDFAGVDLGFFDIRPLELRISLIRPVFDAMLIGGAIVIDDVHKPHFRPHVRHIIARLPCTLYNLRGITVDSYERYAYLVIK